MTLSDTDIYWPLSSAARVGPNGPLVRRNMAQYAEFRGRVTTIIAGVQEETLIEWRNQLESQIWKNTCDYGDMRMRAATVAVYNEFCEITGLEKTRK